MNGKARVIFLGGKSIGFDCLKHLIDHSNIYNIEIAGVFGNSSSKLSSANSVHSLCEKNGITYFNSRNLLARQENVDYLISVQYDKILTEEEILVANKMAVNLHMAPVPEYRGCNQFSFAIVDGVDEFGTTLHRLERGIDSGDVIAERRFKVNQNIFVQELHKQTEAESLQLFIEHIGSVFTETYGLVSQVELAKNRKSGFHLRSEIDKLKKIDPSWPIEKQKRYFRATWFPPYSPPTDSKTGKDLSMNWYNSL